MVTKQCVNISHISVSINFLFFLKVTMIEVPNLTNAVCIHMHTCAQTNSADEFKMKY